MTGRHQGRGRGIRLAGTRGPRRSDAEVDVGAAAMTTVLLVLLVWGMVVGSLAVVGRIAVRVQVVTSAADRVALAVMSGSALVGGRGVPDIEAGRDIAGRSGATLEVVDIAGWPYSVVVTVTADLGLPIGGDAHVVTAAATVEP